MSTSIPTVSATLLRAWLHDGQEVALLDVREAGQFGEGHPFFAVSLPYSRLELEVARLVPRRTTRTVLLDAGDGVAERAAARLHRLGYTALHVLAGGAAAWAVAGYTLFKGVNVPSKTFGEQVEQVLGTPHMSAQEFHARRIAGEPLVLLDGRTFEEHRKMTVPGAVSVPNGELAWRWRSLVPDPATPVIIHCAGRTRSLIGAQILRNLGLPNPVFALENGTQGWSLAGLELERGSGRQSQGEPNVHPADVAAAARDAAAAGAPVLSVAQAQAWLDDERRTTFVLDVREAEEFARGTLAGARHAPGGQLLQATDLYVGVRGSRVLVLDHEAVRAPVIAAWLRRLGYAAATVEHGVHAPLRVSGPVAPRLVPLPQVGAQALADWVSEHHPHLFDLQSSLAYRRQHAAGAAWTLRPRLPVDAAPGRDDGRRPVLLLATDARLASLAAVDLRELGWQDVRWTHVDSWLAAGLPTASTSAHPPDAAAIDHLFFVHDRHEGNLDAARRYLQWETGLLAQCDADELATFRLPPRH